MKKTKYKSEFAYWKKRFDIEGELQNRWYEKMMLDIAGETNQEFLANKIVADFGCGPRGSLCWATEAKERIGIDVLVDEYRQFILAAHSMTYIKSGETKIPISDNRIDILYTINSLDHVDHLETMCKEITRVIKKGGLLLGSFNLNEPATPCEPQTLNFDTIQEHLLRNYFVQTKKVEKKEKKEILKVRAIKL